MIVRALTTRAAAAAVDRVGGTVERRLDVVDGVSATVPADRIEQLGAADGVEQITPDGHVGFQADDYTLGPQRVQKIVRSDQLWAQGTTGRGVGVALLDTGIYAHPDLAGRIRACVDLSAEAGTEAECNDTFGHGTFMAGLIAGNGAASGGKWKGSAPEASLVSVKVAGFDGSTDVSNVLAGIQWVVSHKDAYNIRVLNLSLGSDSTQTYALAPLNYAVEKAWKAGIVVVVAAGNDGPDNRTVLKPADDPYVITVGAADDLGTIAIGDDRVPVFSGRGPTSSNGVPKPDVVSPGVHTVSLRAPGSAIDQQFGATATVAGHYFRGTGTSMATATVSGIVAQILQANPSLDPNQVKYRLTSTARRIADTDQYAAGKGLVDAYAATRSTSTARANEGLLLGLGTGLGSLQADRGGLGLDVYSPAGQLSLSGERTAQYDPSDPLQLVAWDPVTYTTVGWDPVTWALTSWVDARWVATAWSGEKWRAATWDGEKWRGADWFNTDWDGEKWRVSDWEGTKWRSSSWLSKWYAAAWE
ncbi:MAG TPA: S8 family peptidase [Actinomycetota bacterium]|nr:S8 family peptidase [Actinomycetota bacterium]